MARPKGNRSQGRPSRIVDDETIKNLTVLDQIAVLESLRQAAAAHMMCRTSRTFQEWKIPANENGRYDARDVIKARARTNEEDEAAERFTRARADAEEEKAKKLYLANMETLSKIVHVEVIHDQWQKASNVIKKGLDMLQDKFGPEALQVMLEALEAAQDQISLTEPKDGDNLF